jgi:DNA-binding response OmpR family regulator
MTGSSVLHCSGLKMNESGFHLLVVDDDHIGMQMIANLLTREGYKVSFDSRGKQAVDIACREPIDLILLDIMMPDMDGYQVCDILKKDDRTRDIPIIFLTCKTEKKDIIQGFNHGAVDYIIKPFDPAELKVRVHTHLELRQARQLASRHAAEIAEAHDHLLRQNEKLLKAMDEIHTLRSMLPMCANCKKILIRSADPEKSDQWMAVESYLFNHMATDISHSICPDCIKALYPDLSDDSVD